MFCSRYNSARKFFLHTRYKVHTSVQTNKAQLTLLQAALCMQDGSTVSPAVTINGDQRDNRLNVNVVPCLQAVQPFEEVAAGVGVVLKH